MMEDVNVLDAEPVEPRIHEEAAPEEAVDDVDHAEKPEKEVSKVSNKKVKSRICRLPLTRVKHIMRFDQDCSLISQEAVVLVAKATELFVEILAREAVKHTNSSKRKTLLKRDLDTVIEKSVPLCFLEGMLEL